MTIPNSRVTIRPVGGAVVDVSCDVADVSITHGRGDPDAQPDASTATVTMPLGMASGVEIGAHVEVVTDPSFVRFVGTVTDMALEWEMRYDVDTGATGVEPVARIMAAGPLADTGRRYVGDAPWPQELDGARVARILALVAGRIQNWTYGGTVPDGWFDQWLGIPGATLTADATEGAMKATWPLGTTQDQGFTWRYATPMQAGKTYTVVAEVKVPVGQPAVRINVLFVTEGEPITGDGQWHTVSHTFTAPDSADRSAGVATLHDAARPAGKFCFIRRYQLFEADAPSLGIVDPGISQILARDVDRQPALELAQSVATDARGVVWETRDGLLSYADSEHRRNTLMALELDACDVVMTPRWTRTRAGLVNDVAVAYGTDPGTGQPVTTAVNDASIAKYGRMSLSLQTQLAALADASAMATLLMRRNSEPVWILESIGLDLATLDAVQTAAVLGLDMHSLVSITGWPAGGPYTSTHLWVEGWTEDIAYGAHALQLLVSGYCRTAPSPRWDDVQPERTWDNTPSDWTWDSVVCIGPIPSSGRWNDTPATLRWNDIAASVTWETWPY